jgi:hypothetical protein
MKRIFIKILRIFSIPAILVGFLPALAAAQAGSAAFDPNCYFPRIGVPGEIDTIYGSYDGQGLGDGMMNIGPSDGDPYGKMRCILNGNYADTGIVDSVFTTGPSFNLHHLNTKGTFPFQITRRGHFRSPRYLDILSFEITKRGDTIPYRIYWQDEQGNFDTNRYTDLRANLKGYIVYDYSWMLPYSSQFSSDTVEDIIATVAALKNDTGTHFNSFMLYFKGGEQLKQKGMVAFSDSIVPIGDPITFGGLLHGIGGIQADFRGVGRNDLLLEDEYHNCFYYKNDGHFSFDSFIYSILHDTIYANWQNPDGLISVGLSEPLMKIFPKSKNDSSFDLIAFIQRQNGAWDIAFSKGVPTSVLTSGLLTAHLSPFIMPQKGISIIAEI